MNSDRKGGLRLLAAIIAATVLSACGAQSASPPKPKSAAAPSPAGATAARPAAATQSPSKLKHVTLQLGWLVYGYYAPFVLAKEKGYYRQAGFDVTIVPGHGGGLATNLVAKGGPIFGALSVSAPMLSIAKGAPVKVVAVYDHESPDSLFYHRGHPLPTPRALIGRPIYAQASAVSYQLLPAVLARYGMSKKQLTIHLTQSQEFPPLFAKHPEAVVVGFADSNYLLVRHTSPDALYKLYADWGVNLYDMGLIANDAMIRQHPAEVRAFVAASTKGWEEARAHPQEAVDATVRAYPHGVKRGITAAGLKLTLKLMATPSTRSHPVGWMSPSDWRQQLALLHKYVGVSAAKPPADFYTDAFVSAGS